MDEDKIEPQHSQTLVLFNQLSEHFQIWGEKALPPGLMTVNDGGAFTTLRDLFTLMLGKKGRKNFKDRQYSAQKRARKKIMNEKST